MAVLRWSREELSLAHREERVWRAAPPPASSSSNHKQVLARYSHCELQLSHVNRQTPTLPGPAPLNHCHTAWKEVAPDDL